MIYLKQDKRRIALGRIQDGVPGQDTRWFNLVRSLPMASIQDGLLARTKDGVTLVRIQDSSTVPEFKDGLPFPDYKMAYLGQYTRWLTLASIKDGLPWPVY
jgi:hypothetical protein